MKKKIDLPYIVMFTLITIGAVAMLMPFIWMLLSSLKSNLEIIQGGATIFPKNPSIDGYLTVFREAPFIKWLLNSTVTSVTVTAIVVFTSTLAGYVFAKFNFKGKKFFFVLILATMMIPFQVYLIPRYLIISELKLINNLLALIVPGLVSSFGIFLSKQFVEGIPNELLESARIDGANEFRIFWSIVLPQLKPSMSALAIFTFMAAWNDYLWPLVVLNDLDRMTVPLALVFFNGQHSVNYNVVMSAAVLIMIPVVILFFIFQKQFIKGLTLTGFK